MGETNKIASKSDSIIDVYRRSCGNIKEGTISYLRGQRRLSRKERV